MINWEECTRLTGDVLKLARQWFKAKPAVTVAAAVLVLVVALVIMWAALSGPATPAAPAEVWFYDLGTKELFAVKSGEIPPIDAPSGSKMGVQALVLGRGDCKSGHRFIAYLTRYTDAGKQAQLARIAAAAHPEAIKERPAPPEWGQEVSGPAGDKWVATDSDAGRKVMDQEVTKQCPPGTRLVPCLP
jgi:hypothetical protein